MTWEPYLAVAPDTDAAAIAALEALLGVVLPDDYRQALARHAGQTPTLGVMPVGTESNAPFGPLLHLATDAGREDMTYALTHALEGLRDWGGDAAAGLVPIASDTASGYFCLDYRSTPVDPPLVFIDMTYRPEDHGAILPVAPNFSAALDRLTP